MSIGNDKVGELLNYLEQGFALLCLQITRMKQTKNLIKCTKSKTAKVYYVQ